jgi:hypothetical protein
MTNYIPKKILITQGKLAEYAGSEIVTLELAQFFSANGSIVTVLSNFIGDPIKKEFLKLKNVTITTSSEGIDFKNMDLIWIHHNLIPLQILDLVNKGKLKAKFVFHQ